MSAVNSSRRRRWALVLGVVLLAAVVAGWAWSEPWERGPYHCAYCPLQTPYPDRMTEGYLKDNLALIDRLWPIGSALGTRFQVCNQTHCATYYLNFDNKFKSAGRPIRIERIPTPPPSPGVVLIEPPPRQPPPRQSVIPRPPMPGKPGRAGCVTVGKKSNPCPTVPL